METALQAPEKRIFFDTYTITYTSGASSTFQVTNGATGATGKGIASITGPTSSGLVDTYTINYTDNTTSTFEVINGADGATGPAGVGIMPQ